MLKAIMFDLGGTLINLGGGSAMSLGLAGAREAFNRLKSRGVRLPSAVSFYAKVTKALSGMAFASGGLTEVDIASEIGKLFAELGVELDERALDEAVEAWYNSFLSSASLAEGAESTLARLRSEHFKMCIVSNSVWRGKQLEKGLDKLGIREFFEFTLASSDIGYRKPSPVIMESALSRLGVSAEEAVMVGDSRRVDVAAAKQVGAVSVLIERETEPGPEPDFTIKTLQQLPDVLLQLRG